MPKKRRPGRRKTAATRRPPIERLRETWTATRDALVSAERRMEKQASALRTRAERERRKAVAAFGRTARETVQSTLAALNIPSREEIAELTRRVEKLSRRLDSRKR